MTTIYVPESRLLEARDALIREAEARFPLATSEHRDAPPPEPREIRETQFITDAEGKIVGKREVARYEPAPVAPQHERPAIPFLTPDELRLASSAPYARRVEPGAIAFDWMIVERALGRALSSPDHRVLKAAAVAAGGGELGDRLDRLAETIVEAQPGI